jgi:hypothetical protein
MGRIKQYASAAARQRAYRQRTATPRPPTAPTQPSRRRPPSRPARLAGTVKVLAVLHDEYEQWLSSLPESLQDTEQA